METTITEFTTSVTETVTTTVYNVSNLDINALNNFIYFATGLLLFFIFWSCCKWVYKFLNMFF